MTSKWSAFLIPAAQLFLAAACTAPAGREPARAEAPPPPSAPATAPAPATPPASSMSSTQPVPGLEATFVLSKRQGQPPKTSEAPMGTNLAHGQLTQQAPAPLQETLFNRAAALPDVDVAPSAISVKGARAFWLKQEAARGPRDAFQVGTEFAHIHPAHDGSLHMKLPPDLAQKVFQLGWGEPHPRSGTPLVYGPRDEAELEVVWQLLLRSYTWAHDGQAVGVAVN